MKMHQNMEANSDPEENYDFHGFLHGLINRDVENVEDKLGENVDSKEKPEDNIEAVEPLSNQYVQVIANNVIESNDKQLQSQIHDIDIYQCKDCDQAFLWKRDFITHKKNHTGGESDLKNPNREMLFEYSQRDEASSKNKLIKPHMKTNDEKNPCNNIGSKMYQCDECDKVFIWKYHLRMHMKTHTGENPFNCSKCNKDFCDKQSLYMHMITHNRKANQCKLCDKSFKWKKTLIKHMKTHTGENQYDCNQCKKKCSDRQGLIYHLTTHNRVAYQCNQCDKEYSSKCNLKAHQKKKHTGESRYNCNLCKRVFSDSQCLIKHLATHKCKQCNMEFREKCNLKTHQRTHTGEKPYQCYLCNKAFSTNDNLKVHIRTHTGEKPYQCKYCNKCFSRNDILITHLRIHEQEKPYKCQHCEKSFSDKNGFRDHLRTHTGEKPYQCSHCAQRFSQNKSLINHIGRKHTLEKAFKCHHCEKAFSLNTILILNLKTHIGKKSESSQNAIGE